MNRYRFERDERLGIELPVLVVPWDSLSFTEQAEVIARWEDIRSCIPERVKQLEGRIVALQHELNEEERFEASCRLNWNIAELASIINDLHLWFRVQQDTVAKSHL
ncbi:hypothetical protein M5W83_04110 [Paenibacillus thiaminolyticus]|uniref:Uncharacterized protein n=1 Tax=Paenibacillus thiaminolyticus TaxID=49283 RepID=A0AAP9J0A1_PANTH|nr:hypothetical protein [Paenibacillus thiaminolyticus]MCY9533443.1 hypothetical protein [Paenibacillus thiaminolyticus]MCY9604108.1 hypothetical protein [Paenibacillus thiaminolyticus]MCY9606344.1 hypothetical protein [Paenibacillus thiaminolyticus]MCY9612094.1 hypothetical protein [Paenibacillus thiaminolyticus]MCY9618115.1 hypothetical protein [Paenibacillus thiaminolyticus]